MNSKVELWINGTGNTNQGLVDLYPDEPITIQMSNSDIKDISKRKSSFTQSFVIPGTKNNNQLFNAIFQIGVDCQFDPRKKTQAYLLVDSIPVMQNGNLQLTGIVVNSDDDSVEYEVSIFDETEDLIDAIGDDYLTDLDYTNLNHIWDYSNVTNSWTGTTSSYFYPLIDYGYDFNISSMNVGNGVEINQLVPAIQTKCIFDKIFSAAGYSYNSTFLSGSYFTHLYNPYNSSVILTQDSGFTTSRLFQAQCTANTGLTTSIPSTGTLLTYGAALFWDLAFTDDFNLPNFDTGGLYIASTHKYSSDTYSNQTFNVQLDYQFIVTGATTLSLARNYIYFFRSTYGGGTIPYNQASDWPGVSPNVRTQKIYSSQPTNIPGHAQLYPAQPGETFWARQAYTFLAGSFATGTTVQYQIYSANTFFYNTVGTEAYPGQTINYNNFIPKKVKQIDFVNSLINMHNLYISPTKEKLKTLKIETRDVYYSGATKDWSEKFDEKIKVKEQLVSEAQNKRIIFTYKEDKDYYNVDYQTSTNKVFGQEDFIVDNDFVKDDKKIELIFSPTPSVAVLESSTSTTNYANEFVIPKIGKRDASNNFGKTDSNIRILQKNAAGLVNLNSADYWKLNGVTQTQYPMLGMLNHPSTGTTDIAFSTVDYEYYTLSSITSNNLINTYWRSYLEQISDKDSKIITANFYLTPEDIQSFDFSDSIFVDGITDDGGHYFIVNSITYTPTSNESSQVELIKVKNKFVDTVTRKGITSASARDTFQSTTLGGATVLSTASVGIGKNVSIGPGSNGSFALGLDLTIDAGSPRSMIVGSGSSISVGVQGAIIFGDNVSATTSNTVYVPNIVIAPGGTINNISFSSITGSSSVNYWSGSSGLYSVIPNNPYSNKATGFLSSVLGGDSNYATNNRAVIVNGTSSRAYGTYSFIGNGGNNSAATTYSTVLNGIGNLASGNKSFIGNGYRNIASAYYSIVVGGKVNNASAYGSFVGGGIYNTASGIKSSVLGGQSNASSGVFSSIAGGVGNKSIAYYCSVLGGYQNTASTSFASVIGGKRNLASGTYSFVGNGSGNTASGTASVVLGGYRNTNVASFSFIGCGLNNITNGTSNSIVGGSYNMNLGTINNFIGAGQNNSAGTYSTMSAIVCGGENSFTGSSTTGSFIGSGRSNRVCTSYSFLGGGKNNTILNQNYSSILNGSGNTATGIHSTILNGKQNTISGAHSTIVAGSGITSSLSQSSIAKHYAVVTGGTDNSAGVTTLVAGASVVTTTKVTNSSMIFLTTQSLGGIAAAVGVAVTARVAGTSFTITSASALDTSKIAWIIFEPAQ